MKIKSKDLYLRNDIIIGVGAIKHAISLGYSNQDDGWLTDPSRYHVTYDIMSVNVHLSFELYLSEEINDSKKLFISTDFDYHESEIKDFLEEKGLPFGKSVRFVSDIMKMQMGADPETSIRKKVEKYDSDVRNAVKDLVDNLDIGTKEGQDFMEDYALLTELLEG